VNFSFNTYIDDTWKVFLNKNAKWSVALLIRTTTLCIILFIFLKTLQYSGVTSFIKNDSQTSVNVIPGATENVSLPSVHNYTKDIKEINDLQTLIKNKTNEISN